MPAADESKIFAVIETFSDPQNEKTLYAICKEKGVSQATVLARLKGGPTRNKADQDRRLLSLLQESIIEDLIIELTKDKTIPSGIRVREFAAKILRTENPEAKVPSTSWWNGFLARSEIIQRNEKGRIDLPRVRAGGETLIRLFFERLEDYEKLLDIPPSRIWNLDECGFKVGETSISAWGIAPKEYHNHVFYGSSELCTVVEVISATGALLTPLYIYKGVHVTDSWIPSTVNHNSNMTARPTAFINSDLFLEWFIDVFPSCGEWQILIMDDCSFHTNEKLYLEALRKKVILLFLPAKMSNVLQSVDRASFGVTKQLLKRQRVLNFMSGLPPSKRNFFQTYNRLRERVYSKKVIEASWSIAGIFPRSPEAVILRFQEQMNNGSVQTPSLLDAASIENVADSDVSTPETESTPKITPMPSSWRAERMYFIRHPDTTLRGLEDYRRKWLVSQAKIVVLQHKIDRLENEIRQNKGKISKRTISTENINKKVYQLLKIHLNLSEENSEDEDSEDSETQEENAEN